MIDSLDKFMKVRRFARRINKHTLEFQTTKVQRQLKTRSTKGSQSVQTSTNSENMFFIGKQNNCLVII